MQHAVMIDKDIYLYPREGEMQLDWRQQQKTDNFLYNAKSGLDELESVIDSDFMNYLHPNVVASMKRLIAKKRRQT